MDGEREAALVVNRIHCGSSRHAGPDSALNEQSDDVPVAARDFLADDDMKSRSFRCVLPRAQGTFDRVVIRNRNDVELGSTGCVFDQFFGSRPPVTDRRVHVEVRSTRRNHGCAWYARQPYHRRFRTFFPTWVSWRCRQWKA